MEQTKEIELKISTFKQALDTLGNSLDIQLSLFNGIVLDTVKSGQVQKFEYCVELCWKTVRSFLYYIHGIESVSPKSSIKELFLTKYIDEKQYELLIEMINDRNRLSHIYKEKYFETIYKRIPNYLKTMNDVYISLKTTE